MGKFFRNLFVLRRVKALPKKKKKDTVFLLCINDPFLYVTYLWVGKIVLFWVTYKFYTF